MTMKRTIAMLLAGLLCLSMAACGGSGDSGSASGSSAGAGAENSGSSYKLALLMSHQTNAFTTAVSAGAVEMGEQLGVQVDVLDGKQDPATQASQIETCIAQGYDGVMVEPISADAIVPAVKAANEAGMPVLTVVQQMKNQDSMAIAYCGGDESKSGQLQMEHVIDVIGEEANIVVLYGPMGSDAQLSRKAGYDEVLANYPGIQIVFEDTASWTTAEALS
ncbi:MAG: sugar ABC transporter substrate-binding protein, partial [Eubacteriales bacterium]|nr:sugar ABC transporter substrate-binding protein [Eubacteriales bacterium]